MLTTGMMIRRLKPSASRVQGFARAPAIAFGIPRCDQPEQAGQQAEHQHPPQHLVDTAEEPVRGGGARGCRLQTERSHHQGERLWPRRGRQRARVGPPVRGREQHLQPGPATGVHRDLLVAHADGQRGREPAVLPTRRERRDLGDLDRELTLRAGLAQRGVERQTPAPERQVRPGRITLRIDGPAEGRIGGPRRHPRAARAAAPRPGARAVPAATPGCRTGCARPMCTTPQPRRFDFAVDARRTGSAQLGRTTRTTLPIAPRRSISRSASAPASRSYSAPTTGRTCPLDRRAVSRAFRAAPRWETAPGTRQYRSRRRRYSAGGPG